MGLFIRMTRNHWKGPPPPSHPRLGKGGQLFAHGDASAQGSSSHDKQTTLKGPPPPSSTAGESVSAISNGTATANSTKSAHNRERIAALKKVMEQLNALTQLHTVTFQHLTLLPMPHSPICPYHRDSYHQQHQVCPQLRTHRRFEERTATTNSTKSAHNRERIAALKKVMEQLNALTEAGDGDALPADIPIDKLDNITEAMKWTEGSQGAVLKELNSTLSKANSKVQSRVVGILKDISDAKEWQAAHLGAKKKVQSTCGAIAAPHRILAALAARLRHPTVSLQHLRRDCGTPPYPCSTCGAIAAPHRILAALAARLRHSTVSLQHLLRDCATPPYPCSTLGAIVAPQRILAALATPALSTEEDPGPVIDPVVTTTVLSTEEDPGPVTGPVVTVTKDGSLLQKEDNKAEQGDVVDLQEIPSSKLEARGHGHGGLGHGVGEGRGKGGGGLGHGVQEGRGKGGGGLGHGVGEGRVTGDGSLGHGDA
eukprot:gene22500-29626_t